MLKLVDTCWWIFTCECGKVIGPCSAFSLEFRIETHELYKHKIKPAKGDVLYAFYYSR